MHYILALLSFSDGTRVYTIIIFYVVNDSKI